MLGAHVILLASALSGGATGRVQAPRLRKIAENRYSEPIQALDLAPGSDLAAIALTGGRVVVWRLDTNELLRDFAF